MGVLLGSGLAGIVGNTGLYALIRDEKAVGVAGGTFTLGAWRTRDLNTKVTDEIGITLASNQMTLPAGDYETLIVAPAIRTQHTRTRLRNVTAGLDVLLSDSHWADEGVDSVSILNVIQGKFTVAAGQLLEVQHWSSRTEPSNGLGVANSIDSKPEIYTVVRLKQVA